MTSFNDLGIEPVLTERLKERDITKPTNIQERVIPEILAANDLIFRSATGTGKTFAYLLPVFSNEQLRGKGIEGGDQLTTGNKVLIVAPTLELAAQIKAEADFLNPSLSSVLLIGSVSIDKQIETLKRIKPVVAVGNPGRLLTLAKMKKLNLRNLQFLVLDEADRLTTAECIDDMRQLLSLIKKLTGGGKIQTIACSATVTENTGAQLGDLFNGAKIIKSDDHEILRDRIIHWAIFSERRKRVQALRSFIAAAKGKKKRIKVLVFTSKGDDAQKILSQLQHHKISASGLFGKAGKKPLSAAQRKEALDTFRHGKADVLVSTDLAARGLDISGISHVISLDVPDDEEIYIHRCGRTGRAGKRGVMVTIGDEVQMRLLASLEKKLKIIIYPKELYQGKVLDL